MGKAGILEGGKGDIMIPSAHIFEGTADKAPVLMQFVTNTLLNLRLLISYIPKAIVRFMIGKLVKDKNFIGTMSFTYSMLVYPLFYATVYYSIKVAVGLY